VTTALVAVGGVLGFMTRYLLGRATMHTDALIWTTVGINILGSFLLGLLVAAGLYVLASVLGGIAAAALGYWLGRSPAH
jgi:fluoride ion exporter CrcB/FEX